MLFPHVDQPVWAHRLHASGTLLGIEQTPSIARSVTVQSCQSASELASKALDTSNPRLRGVRGESRNVNSWY